MAESPPPSPRSTTAFEVLFARERLPMTRLASLLVGSAEVAEEVVQEAFAAVDQRWDELIRPGAYLRTSVVNGCRAVLRRRAIEERYLATRTPRVDLQGPTPLLELQDALERLSERQRVVVVLRYFSDVPDTEIAEILACRPATVRSLLRRALSALRKDLT
jgi:RNA polymerase sigma factor (sigma-70 family)